MLIKYPVMDHTVSQGFGNDTSLDPIYGSFYALFDNKHCGIDFPVPIGTQVFASFSGVVVRNEVHKGMGRVVGIRNGNIVALYAHLSNSDLKLGSILSTGKLIGFSGSSGDACPTPHLHFELRDISKKTLKDMVFEPLFNETPANYAAVFNYIVNNTNTHKTLANLANMFFGITDMWELIKAENKFNYSSSDLLPDGLCIRIPNYNFGQKKGA